MASDRSISRWRVASKLAVANDVARHFRVRHLDRVHLQCHAGHFTAPGKPMETGLLEGFDDQMRHQLLNEALLFDLDVARAAN